MKKHGSWNQNFKGCQQINRNVYVLEVHMRILDESI